MAKTMLMSSLFGLVEYDTEDGFWEYLEPAQDGCLCPCRLDMEAHLEDFCLMQQQLDAIPQMIAKARTAILAGYPADETISMFVDFQIGEIEAEALMACLGVQTREEITPQKFLQKLKLTGVSVDGSYACVLDFCLDQNVTNELLVVTFDRALNILSILHES